MNLAMQPYRNLDGHSGIEAFALADDEIIVRFRTGEHRIYGYNRASVGEARLQRMRQLAQQGAGLNRYINSDIGERYAWKR